MTTRPADPVPLPAAEALADLANRLADPAVPGAEKLPLLQNGAAPDVITLDRFSAALRDGGYDPAVFTVTDVRGADKPGDALAMVTVHHRSRQARRVLLPDGVPRRCGRMAAHPEDRRDAAGVRPLMWISWVA